MSITSRQRKIGGALQRVSETAMHRLVSELNGNRCRSSCIRAGPPEQAAQRRASGQINWRRVARSGAQRMALPACSGPSRWSDPATQNPGSLSWGGKVRSAAHGLATTSHRRRQKSTSPIELRGGWLSRLVVGRERVDGGMGFASHLGMRTSAYGRSSKRRGSCGRGAPFRTPASKKGRQ